MRNFFSTVFTYQGETDIDPRLDMEQRLRLPRWLLDWFTGKPLLDGKSKRNRLDPIAYLALDIGLIAATTAAAASIAATGPLWVSLLALPPLWTIQTGRLRKLQTLEGHEAAHGNFFLAGDARRRSRRRFLGLSPNDLFGEMATAVALSHNIVDYKKAHDVHHAIPTFASSTDPDTQIVLGLLDYPSGLANPVAYVRDFAGRLRSNLVTARPARRVMAILVLAVLGGLALLLPFWAWVAAVLLPWVVGFRLASALQIVSLHEWEMTPVRDLQDYANRTRARFSGVPLPARGLSGAGWLKAWTLFWLEMLFVELPFRVGVLSPDLQAHDAHHLEWIMVHYMEVLHFFDDDWRNQPYRRAEMMRDSGDPLSMASREIWGVRRFMALGLNNLRRLRN